MDHADDGNTDVVFIYMGSDQRVPKDVTHIRIHESVKIIRRRAFRNCRRLVSIEMHDGVEIIKEEAFHRCESFREIKLPGVRFIEEGAFWGCTALEDVEFGDKLEVVKAQAFANTPITTIKMPKVRVIGDRAFFLCEQLTDVELSKDLEGIVFGAFLNCPRLRRITLPLKANLLGECVFINCDNLSHVDLEGGIHKTISSLLLERWRNEMKNEIDRINRDLPNTQNVVRTEAIRQWMERVLQRIEHYKSEHLTLLKEFTTLLELALWKAKLDKEFGFEEALSKEDNESTQQRKLRLIQRLYLRQEQRITSGASIVIKNVLPFLKLE